MKRRIQFVVALVSLVAIVIALDAHAHAQQQSAKKPVAPSVAQPAMKLATPAVVRPGAVQQPKEKPKELKSLADGVSTKGPVRRASSLQLLQRLGLAYEATIASKLDELDPQHADDVAVIKTAFKQLQNTKDSKEADQIITKLSLLLTNVPLGSKQVSTLDVENVSSVANALRSMGASEKR